MHALDRGDGGKGQGQMDRFSQTKKSRHNLSLAKARSWREEECSPGTPCLLTVFEPCSSRETEKNTVRSRTSFPPPMVVYCWKHGPKQINSPKLGLGGDTPPRVELGQEGGDGYRNNENPMFSSILGPQLPQDLAE